MDVDFLDEVEAERRRESFRVDLGGGQTLRMVDPRSVDWRVLCEPNYRAVPQLVDPRDGDVLEHLISEDVEPIGDAYRAHYGIGCAPEAAELVWVLARCGDQAVYDLAVRGLELGELWRERRWRLLWTVLMHLPRNSPTKERLACNEEFVERVLARASGDEDEDRVTIGMREFSPEVEALYHVTDRLGDVVSGLVGLGGGKPRRAKPMRRPQTAFDLVKNRRRLAEHKSLAARVLAPADQGNTGFPMT